MPKNSRDDAAGEGDAPPAKERPRRPSFFDGESYKGYKVSVRLVREGLDEHNPVRITGADAAYKFMKGLESSDRERFYSLCLHPEGHVVGCEEVASGSMEKVLVHLREVFKSAILSSSSALVVVHNHPAGNSEPSLQDAELTRQLYEAGELLGIQLLDSIVIGRDSYYSFEEAGMMKMYRRKGRG
jgi:DNA repair protein RadC